MVEGLWLSEMLSKGVTPGSASLLLTTRKGPPRPAPSTTADPALPAHLLAPRRALGQVSERTGAHNTEVKNVIICE